MLELVGLPHFTFHALRHTFASRAMEQKMDASVILSKASVAFGLNTYTHVLIEHKHEGMALLNGLFDIRPYPIVIIFTPDGHIDIMVPNFPNSTYYGPNLQEKLLACIFQPQPISTNQIPLTENQQVLMITPGR